MKRDVITIIDFGGQYAHLIANRIRRLGVYTRIVLNDVDIQSITDSKGIILSGGPQSVNTPQSPLVSKALFNLGIPLLGICYGHQLFTYTFGGKIGNIPEYGRCKLFIKNTSDIFSGCSDTEYVWQNHGDAALTLPEGFEVIASTKDNEVSAMKHMKKKWYSVQFHPEVTHSGDVGKKIFSNFVFNICKAKPSWNMEIYLKELRSEIKDFVGEKNVFLLVSGGVDSTVCFALLNDILGKDRVFGLHIDNGFMRKNESEYVKKMLDEKGFTNLEVYNAEDDFFSALKNVYDPEEKRKIIGKIYLDVKDQALAHYDLESRHWLLAQGTIYPDTIESGGTKYADTIKTHHNRVDQIQDMILKGLIVEPLKELYKDEVRELGKLLGLPDHLINRHPFPGPGLAIRALCSASSGDDVSKREHVIHVTDGSKVENVHVYVLPLRSVGIKGDARSYAHPCALSGPYDFEALLTVMTSVTNNHRDINRVIYNILDADLEKAVLQKQYITKEYMDILREADDITMSTLEEKGLMKKVWQCPTVIVPLGTKEQKHSIILRPIDSVDAMSAAAVDLGKDTLKEIALKIKDRCPTVYAVFYDLTSKPPGTIEWE